MEKNNLLTKQEEFIAFGDTEFQSYNNYKRMNNLVRNGLILAAQVKRKTNFGNSGKKITHRQFYAGKTKLGAFEPEQSGIFKPGRHSSARSSRDTSQK